MKVLVVGSGGREHALAWRLSRDRGTEVLCAPGNAGIATHARCVPVDPKDHGAIVDLARLERVGLVVVGPEAPLVAGLADSLTGTGIPTFGPSKAAARLEGSKVESKLFMARHKIPTAGFEIFEDPAAAEAYIERANRPLVVKADGLAAGKGVVVAADASEALEAIAQIMRARAFGDAGARVVVEECLAGQEVSFHVIADGERWVPLAPAQDHKRVFDGDKGPNTGGMGAYSPPPIVNAALEAKILSEVVEPTLRGMAAEGTPFRGVLFVGLMIVDGAPQVLEYNVRFGDPETQVLMPRIAGSLTELLLAAATSSLKVRSLEWIAPAALSIVLASGGYPGKFTSGHRIHGLAAAGAIDGVNVFHAATRREGDALLSAGGRVLTVSAIGNSIDEAARRAYRAVDLIDFEGKHFRGDIGWRART